MRIGISSRGNAWLSMGPLGWIILGPFVLAWYLLWIILAVLYQLGVIAVRAVRR